MYGTYIYKVMDSFLRKRSIVVGGEMIAPAKNVQRAANESDHGRFPRELHELVERRCHRHSPRHYTVDDFTKNMLKM